MSISFIVVYTEKMNISVFLMCLFGHLSEFRKPKKGTSLLIV